MTNNIDLSNFSVADLKKIQSYISKLEKNRQKPKRKISKKRPQKIPQKQRVVEEVETQTPKRVRKIRSEEEQQIPGISKGSACVTESIKKGKRINQFDKLDIAHLHKTDTKIDKKLIGENEPTPRTKTRLVSVKCRVCDKVCKISPKLVYREDGELVYTCDKCLTHKGK